MKSWMQLKKKYDILSVAKRYNHGGIYTCTLQTKKRYDTMVYNRCGKSGLKLPVVSLGLWHNFGDTSIYENMKQMCFTSFDNGITHFDLANNYGPAYGDICSK